VFQMAADVHQPSDETELTPIFHALARRAADPVTQFHRDPLAAPLPSTEQDRAALRAVPARSAPGSHRSVADNRTRVGGTSGVRIGGRHCRVTSPVEETRGGRHRVLRAVNHPGER
jgi:hypothetical protein